MEKQTFDPQKLETLRMLYPIFKREVFDRRDRMMKIAGLGSGFLLLLQTLMLYLSISSGLLIIGVIIFTVLTVAQIFQQSRRHEQAKQAVIEIEKALGLFEPGTYLPDRSLYPQHWQTRPSRDYGLILYTLGLVALAVLVVLSLLITI
ncbi:MAG TPA: hypothetical protein VJM77_05955 [Nitrospiria bacterium]|nr:hypothetical protein [Nitrospiria bacterium]